MPLLHESSDFAEKVKKANGKVIVLVHPYYDLFLLDARYKYAHKINAILCKSKVPVIILEEQKNIDAGRVNQYAGAHYLVPTIPHDPTPTHGWQKLHDALHAAGVKTILIGGMYSGHGTSGLWNSNNQELSEKIKDICQHDVTLPRKPKKSIIYGCVSGAYYDFIKAAAKPGSTYKKIRLLPQVLAPDKLKYVSKKATR